MYLESHIQDLGCATGNPEVLKNIAQFK